MAPARLNCLITMLSKTVSPCRRLAFFTSSTALGIVTLALTDCDRDRDFHLPLATSASAARAPPGLVAATRVSV
eukprot:687033-Rhodomonas_salina.1